MKGHPLEFGEFLHRLTRRFPNGTSHHTSYLPEQQSVPTSQISPQSEHTASFFPSISLCVSNTGTSESVAFPVSH